MPIHCRMPRRRGAEHKDRRRRRRRRTDLCALCYQPPEIAQVCCTGWPTRDEGSATLRSAQLLVMLALRSSWWLRRFLADWVGIADDPSVRGVARRWCALLACLLCSLARSLNRRSTDVVGLAMLCGELSKANRWTDLPIFPLCLSNKKDEKNQPDTTRR